MTGLVLFCVCMTHCIKICDMVCERGGGWGGWDRGQGSKKNLTKIFFFSKKKFFLLGREVHKKNTYMSFFGFFA